MKIKYLHFLMLLLVLLTSSCQFNGTSTEIEDQFIDANSIVGDRPGISAHVSQEAIDSGAISLVKVISIGEILFLSSFNALDGAGRPETNGDIDLRDRQEFPNNFNRISGPDANACSGCHNLPFAGGGGDNVANVFVSAGEIGFVDFGLQSLNRDDFLSLQSVGNERNTLGMFGSGYIELLAKEMSDDLAEIRHQAFWDSRNSGSIITVALVTKGVDFGTIEVHPDGVIYTDKIEGIDEDLVIKPFGQKGSIVSLRQFSVAAMNLHHGMQAVETYGLNTDLDQDGVINELTVGDMTAISIFQATLPPPEFVKPDNINANLAVKEGRELFTKIGCSSCHIQELPLESTIFSEPNPYNPNRIYSEENGATPLYFDLIDFHAVDNFNRDEKGNLLIPVFTDLKRHEMGARLDNELVGHCERSTSGNCEGIPSGQWITRKLWGFASEPPFLHHGRATLIGESINAHGGEASKAQEKFSGLDQMEQNSIIEFLQTMQIPTTVLQGT